MLFRLVGDTKSASEMWLHTLMRYVSLANCSSVFCYDYSLEEADESDTKVTKTGALKGRR